MALPLPRVIPDVGPGGGLVTALGGMNALNDAYATTKYNKSKADYAPLTIPAQAYSQLAYANAVAPQILAKLLVNKGALANMTPEQQKNTLSLIYKAGNGQTNGFNLLNNMPHYSGIGQASTNNFSNYLKNLFGAFMGKHPMQANNPISQMSPNNPINQISQNIPQIPVQQNNNMQPTNEVALNALPGKRPKNGVSVEGQQWYDKNGNPVYEEANKRPGNAPIELELTKYTNPTKEQSWEDKQAKFESIIEEGKVLGGLRGKAIESIGEQQLNLSKTGANLDRIIDDINDPKFMALRKDFPFYQDMQLRALGKIGSPEQQEMIGNFIADVKSFAGATVNSFRGSSMKREFDYAEQLKPSENDTVSMALGKLTALKSLNEIAERKNDIILYLMQDKHMNLGDAVKQANKMVDVKAIEKETNARLQRKIEIKNSKTGEKKMVTLEEARKLGVPNV